MKKQLDPKISEVLKQYGFDKDAVWNCHGTWVVLHKVLEQIAAKAGVKYERPEILVAEREAAAVLVTGSLGEASEWSIGEAVIGLNYKVKNNQPGYPFAMAEKRAKDRVILKLIGLHGLAYSEEEADEFKESAPKQPDGQDWAQERDDLTKMVQGCESMDDLLELWRTDRMQNFIKNAPQEFSSPVIQIKDRRKSEIQPVDEAA